MGHGLGKKQGSGKAKYQIAEFANEIPILSLYGLMLKVNIFKAQGLTMERVTVFVISCILLIAGNIVSQGLIISPGLTLTDLDSRPIVLIFIAFP